MHSVKILLLVLGIVAVSACAKPTTEVISTEIAKPTLIVPQPDKLSMRTLSWTVITKDNASTILDASYPDSYLALTAKDYENLALNMQDIQAYIKQQQQIILAYKTYYEGAK